MNAIFDTLNTVINAILATLLANIHASEWVAGMLIIFSVWWLANRHRSASVGFAVLVLTVVFGAWLSLRTGHSGVMVQHMGLAALAVHGQLRMRGWALVKGGAK